MCMADNKRPYIVDLVHMILLVDVVAFTEQSEGLPKSFSYCLCIRYQRRIVLAGE